MKIKEALQLFILLFVVFVAGCVQTPTGGETGETGNKSSVISTQFGEVLLSLEDLPSQILINDQNTFTIKVENQGSEDARNVLATVKKKLGDFTFEGDLNQLQLTFVDLEKKLPGKIYYDQKPILISTGSVTGNAVLEVTVDYDYSTELTGSVDVYNYDYLKAKIDLLKEILETPSISYSYVSKAPLVVQVIDHGPYFYRSLNGQDTGYLEFVIINSGDGIVKYGGKIRNVKVTIRIGDTVCKNDELVELSFVDNTKKIMCSFNIPSIDTSDSLPIYVSAEYTYEITKEIGFNIITPEQLISE